MAALLGGPRRRGAQEVGQAGKVRLAVEHERVGLLVGEHVLAELRAEGREPLGDRGEARLAPPGRAARRRARRWCGSVEHARLLGVEGRARRAVAERLDAPEQRSRSCRSRCDAASSGAISRSIAWMHVVGVRAGEVEEDGRDAGAGAGRSAPAPRSCCRSSAPPDRPAIASISPRCSAERAVEGRPEMLRRDALEGRQAIRRIPLRRERLTAGRVSFGLCRSLHRSTPHG